jgi:hypothetical protein
MKKINILSLGQKVLSRFSPRKRNKKFVLQAVLMIYVSVQTIVFETK